MTAHGRVAEWKDSITFYDDILAKHPKAALADANTAIDLNSGRPQYFQLTPQSG